MLRGHLAKVARTLNITVNACFVVSRGQLATVARKLENTVDSLTCFECSCFRRASRSGGNVAILVAATMAPTMAIAVGFAVGSIFLELHGYVAKVASKSGIIRQVRLLRFAGNF